MNDRQFIAALGRWLVARGRPKLFPAFKKSDGTVDREKTLAQSMFEGFRQADVPPPDIRLLVNITDKGVIVVRGDKHIPEVSIPVEEQDRLGVMCCTSDLAYVKQALTDCLNEATAEELKAADW